MGQKIHPTGFRLSVSRNWASRWYASNRDFAGMLAEDIKVREYLKAKLKNASVARILIERPAKNARITIFSARPGVVIGKKGEDIENLKAELTKRLGVPVAVNAVPTARSATTRAATTVTAIANFGVRAPTARFGSVPKVRRGERADDGRRTALGVAVDGGARERRRHRARRESRPYWCR